MPVVMICTLALILLGVFVYQRVVIQQIARSAAERLSFTWDNSRKDLITGAFDPAESDGLYWRLTQDSITDLFGMLFSASPAEVKLPANTGETSGLVESKLAKASDLLPIGVTGSARYTNYIADHQVEVELVRPMSMPPYVSRLFQTDQVTGRAMSHVIDPVELIRLTDITRTYLKFVKGRISPEEAKAALQEPSTANGSAASVTIRSEREASIYLQSLVGGASQVLTTPSGKSRTIDALDSRGIAHQAFYTFTEAQLLAEQMPKDAELLQEGTRVKGVVWHFFKKSAGGRGVPSESLRNKLEQQGIVVVVHN
ncbi:hypothetical protein [Paenibacillus hexagrammi]|uniref:Type II secretion system protein K n=1 Tax=Paenibacillus hexagrammi TaxID=2908839 RepID=A0ABY3SSC8_9BACL|nr:hypothetical protein [Paenibacillus sp. YPD9-1]UJF36343.1 hypothetical protein L0M14_13225 [Paenibacillus sp. YPD9-1]